MLLIRKLTGKVAYTLTIFLTVELCLRLLGFTPYNPPAPSNANFYESDEKLGWVHIPGAYQFAVNTKGDTMALTINKNKERITKPIAAHKSQKIISLIGGSFTMGIGLNDDQTFAWKLQEKFPLADIRNLGVGAYGTYQSLLALEDQLKRGRRPDLVIYGFIDHHRLRNVSDSDWLTALIVNNKYSDLDVTLPYVSLGENKTLIRHKSRTIVRLPLSETLAISYMTQRVINKISGYGRVRKADKVLELLLIEMQQLCKKHDIPFYVSILASEESVMSGLIPFFDQNEMAYIDCNVPLSHSNTFRDDGHPKEGVNAEWAKRIGNRLVQDGFLRKGEK